MATTQPHAPARRPRVLLLAYACGPGRGSEPGVGWARALTSAERYDTWVLCEKREFAESIEAYLAEQGPIEGLTFVYVPKPAWAERLGRIPGMAYLAYNLWHRRAYRAARGLHARLGFDLVHQANMCGFREPGYLWKLDAPFVWGPVGGAQNYPWRFLPEAGLVGGLGEGLRTLLNRIQLRWSPRVRQALGRASAFLAASTTNRQAFMRAHGAVAPLVLRDVGVWRVADLPRPARNPGKPLRILWSGQFRPLKALPLLLGAMAQLPETVPHELRVLGDGSQRARWQRLARRLGVDAHITWLGWLPHREALRQYAWADVFVFTSLRDTTGGVILEALSAGAPVICLDHQGAGDCVTNQCGFKIPVTTPRDVAARIGKALATLSSDPTCSRRLSEGALQRAREYLWSRNAATLAAVYDRVLGQPASEPEKPLSRSAHGQVVVETSTGGDRCA